MLKTLFRNLYILFKPEISFLTRTKEPVGFDIRVAVRRLADETGVHLGRAKSINRLRNLGPVKIRV